MVQLATLPMASFIYIGLKCPSFLIFQTIGLLCEGENDKAAVTIQLTGQYGTSSFNSFFLPYTLQNLNHLFSSVLLELHMTLVLHNVDFYRTLIVVCSVAVIDLHKF